MTFFVLVLVVSAEFYWLLIDYSFRPAVFYYAFLLTATFFARYVLLQRVRWMCEHFGYLSGKVALDWQLRWILNLYYVLNLAMICEYLVRHVIGFRGVVYIYNAFSELSLGLQLITLIAIYMNYFHSKMKNQLIA